LLNWIVIANNTTKMVLKWIVWVFGDWGNKLGFVEIEVINLI